MRQEVFEDLNHAFQKLQFDCNLSTLQETDASNQAIGGLRKLGIETKQPQHLNSKFTLLYASPSLINHGTSVRHFTDGYLLYIPGYADDNVHALQLSYPDI